MKEEEIIEGNKLIAEFMEYEYDEDIERYVTPHSICEYDIEPYESEPDDWTCALTPDQMLFNQSWDWLMPVVKKLQNLEIEFFRMNDALIEAEIDNVYVAVIVFIKWYNEQEMQNGK